MRPSSLQMIAVSDATVTVSMYPPTSCCKASSVFSTSTISGSQPGFLRIAFMVILSLRCRQRLSERQPLNAPCKDARQADIAVELSCHPERTGGRAVLAVFAARALVPFERFEQLAQKIQLTVGHVMRLRSIATRRTSRHSRCRAAPPGSYARCSPYSRRGA